MIEGLRHDLSEAMAGCRHGSRYGAGEALQAADLGHFDHRGVPGAGVRRVDHLARRPRGIDSDPREPRGDGGVERSFAAVRHRALHRRQRGVRALHTQSYCLGGLPQPSVSP